MTLSQTPASASASSPSRRGQLPLRSSPPLLREVYGGLIRALRTRQGRTLTDVAGRAGISVAYLSEIERGLKEASSEILEAVCTALGSGLVHLVGGAHRELLRETGEPRGAGLDAQVIDLTRRAWGCHGSASAVVAQPTHGACLLAS